MGTNCKRNSWIAAAILGILVFLIALPGFFWALVLGVVVALIVGYLLTTFVCKGESVSTTTPSQSPSAQSAAAVAAPTAAPQPTGTATGDRPANSGAATSGAADTPAPTPTPLMATGTAAADPVTEASDPAPAVDPTPPPAPEPVPAAPATGEGTKPAGLSAARDGQPDDLKRIKGVGPKLEILLNELGYFHFDQIAAWTPDEVAWVDQNLKGFKGRVSRDNWVDQAGQLASGAETEFSKRVDKGGVY